MPVIEVWCLPEQMQYQLRALHKGVVESVVSVEALGLKDETQMTTLFPLDAMHYGLGTIIILKTWGLISKPERTLEVRERLAEQLGRRISGFFPEAKVESFVLGWGSDQDVLWCTDGFRNMDGYWSFQGPFEVHLTEDAKLDNVANYAGITIDGTVVKVGLDPSHPGRIKQSTGNIQCHAGDDQPFYWSYKFVKKYTRPDGSLIWLNKNHR